MAAFIFLFLVMMLTYQNGNENGIVTAITIAISLAFLCVLLLVFARKFRIKSQYLEDAANVAAIVAFISGLVIFVYQFSFSNPTNSQQATEVLAINSTATQIPTVKSKTSAEPLVLSPIATDTPTPFFLSNQRISPVDGMAQLLVSAGDFEMGAANGDTSAEEIERPLHSVYLDDFYIDKTEVTNSMWRMCVEEGACQEPTGTRSNLRSKYFADPTYADFPVIFVTWDAANAYCHWAKRDLPSEAQWEKAARGDDQRRWPWGEEPPSAFPNLLNFYYSGTKDTTVVGSYPLGASPYGALDMAGNIWEWVADYYSPDYYKGSPERDPIGPKIGNLRVLRGGSWNTSGLYARTSNRYPVPMNFVSNEVGFRCSEIPLLSR